MNTVQLIGNLTRDSDLRSTNGGSSACTIGLAVNRRKRDGQEEPVYVDVGRLERRAVCAPSRRAGPRSHCRLRRSSSRGSAVLCVVASRGKLEQCRVHQVV